MIPDSIPELTPGDLEGLEDRAPRGATTWMVLSDGERHTLQFSMLVSYIVLFATYAGVLTILLPQQVTNVDPAEKVNNLAVVTATSSFFALFAHPLIGALSDRTRSRWGSRTPWILLGGVGGGAATIALQFSGTIFWITIAWVVAQTLLHAFQGPVSTLISDRVSPAHRATTSSFTGAGLAIGGALGIVIAGQLLTRLGIAYTSFGLAMIVVSALFVVANKDASTAHLPREQFHLGKFVKGFWISPRKHPDYAWAFAGRFMMILGYQAIQTYQLYILTDYIGLHVSEAGRTAGFLSAIAMVALTVSTLVFGRLSDVSGRRKPFVFVASMVMAIAVVIPLFAPNLWGMVAFAFLMGSGFGAYSAVDLALMVDVLPASGTAGKDLGILQIATSIPQAITPVVAALILGLSGGNYAAIFVYAGVAVTVSSFLVLPIRSVR